ncbi:hypothetical protein DL766_009211 [Monosporascus sp. MC13-8B]|nr:hypothetical protein DL766_009211 [Monosporascus sp. MC13-8B]
MEYNARQQQTLAPIKPEPEMLEAIRIYGDSQTRGLDTIPLTIEYYLEATALVFLCAGPKKQRITEIWVTALEDDDGEESSAGEGTVQAPRSWSKRRQQKEIAAKGRAAKASRLAPALSEEDELAGGESQAPRAPRLSGLGLVPNDGDEDQEPVDLVQYIEKSGIPSKEVENVFIEIPEAPSHFDNIRAMNGDLAWSGLYAKQVLGKGGGPFAIFGNVDDTRGIGIRPFDFECDDAIPGYKRRYPNGFPIDGDTGQTAPIRFTGTFKALLTASNTNSLHRHGSDPRRAYRRLRIRQGPVGGRGPPALPTIPPREIPLRDRSAAQLHHRHVALTRESIRAGKAVYVEWPLAENYDAAVALFGQGRIDNSIAGLQGRVSPIALKLRELLKTGRIGRISIGGNPITIAYAHTIDYVHDILGEFASFESRMQIQRQAIRILRSDGTQTGEVQSDVPDFLVFHGKLARGKADIVDDATLAATFRTGQQFKGTPGFVWSINGEKDEILVTASGAYLHSDSYGEPIKIQVHDHATDEVTDVAWDWKDWQRNLPVRARIVGELYERYAHWWENGRPSGTLADGEEWPRLHDAVERINEVRELFAQYDAGLVPL